MPVVDFVATVCRWGNNLGFVIPMNAVRQLELKPGEIVHLTMKPSPRRNNANNLPTLDLAVDYDIDEILEEEFVKDHLGEKGANPTDPYACDEQGP